MKIYKLVIVIVVLTVFTSCFGPDSTRRVVIVVPEHEWEKYNTDTKLWYTLKWTDGYSTRSLHLDADTRTAEIDIPCGETVLICAYPLGSMDPFGCAVQPDDPKVVRQLTYEDGFLCSMLIDCDRDVIGCLNYRALRRAVDECCPDILCLDGISLMRDMLNGKLRKSSIVTLPRVHVVLSAFPGGVWTSSRSGGGRLVVSTGQTIELDLPPGLHIWWCRELGLKMKVAVDRDGSVFCYAEESGIDGNTSKKIALCGYE